MGIKKPLLPDVQSAVKYKAATTTTTRWQKGIILSESNGL